MSIMGSGGGGGQTEAQVDARVVVKTSGIETMFLYPGANRWSLAIAATFTTINTVVPCLQLAVSGGTYAQAHFAASFPKKWDSGQMRWRMKWACSTADTGTHSVLLIGHFVAEGVLPAAGGTANMQIDDTPLGTGGLLQLSPWSSWQTIDGTGDSEKLFVGRIQRQGPSDAGTGNTKIAVVEIQYTTDAPTDD